MNPMVQRLMSNPGIHSVESIEAEQRRSTSPNNGVSSSPPDQMNPNTKKLNDLESQLKQKLQIGSNKAFAPVKSPSQAATNLNDGIKYSTNSPQPAGVL